MVEQSNCDELGPKDLINVFKKRTKIDYDVVVAITGEEGSSKSTLATQCVVESLLFDGISRDKVPEELSKYTIFSPNKQRVKQQITDAPRYSTINADEAIKILYKLNWNSDIQKFLNMLYALCRKENKISLLCMPRFTDFNEFFRKHRIKFWIHVLDRGVGVLFAKDWNPFTDDPWWMKEGMDIVKTSYGKKKVSDFGTEEKIRILSKVRNFVAIIKFNDLDSDIKKIYKKGKEEFGYDDMENDVAGDLGSGKRAELYQESLKNTALELNKRGIPNKEISKIIKMSVRTVERYLKDDSDNDTRTSLNNNHSRGDNFDETFEE